MFNIRSFGIVLITICSGNVVKSETFTNQFLSAQQQYEIAMKKLITVYNAQQPAKPILFSQSDVLGSAYAQVIRPYVAELSGYAGVVMSAYARSFPYHDNLKTLQEKFDEYNAKVTSLSKLFPEKYQKSAVLFFYNQLTDSVLQNCAKIVQHISFALSTKKEDVDSAKIAYQLAWSVQTPDMKVKTFADIKEFRKNMTTWMINLYQAVISDATNRLQQVENKKELYEEIAQHYQTMAEIYANVPDQQNAAVEQQNAQQAKQSAEQFTKADQLVTNAEKLSQSGRQAIIIDFTQPAQTKASLTKSLQDLQQAQKILSTVLQMYTSLQDNAAVNKCTAKIQELSGDIHIRAIQLLWVLFLQDEHRQGITPTVKAHEVLKNFFAADPTQSAIDLASVQQALNDMILVCTKVPNNFNQSLAILPVLQGAIQEYQSATSGHPHAHSKDRLADVGVLHDLETLYQDFVSMLQQMSVFGSTDSRTSPSQALTQAVVQAKHVDTLMAKNSLIKDLCINVAHFNTQVTQQKSTISFVVQYAYRVVLSRVSGKVLQSNTDPQTLMQDLLYLIALQGYKAHMTDDQWNQLQLSTKKVVTLIDLAQQLTILHQKARTRNRWQNTAKPKDGYQSVSDNLWHTAMELYRVAIQLSTTENAADYALPTTQELQATYVAMIQEYVTAFLQKEVTFTGYQLHLCVPLYELYLAAQEMKNNDAVSYAESTLQTLFSGKTGFFEDVKSMQATQQSAKSGIKHQKNGSDPTALLAMISLTMEQQAQMLERVDTLFTLSQEPNPLLEKSVTGDAYVVSMKFAGLSDAVRIANPQALALDTYVKQAKDLLALAEQDEKNMQYAQAMKAYDDLQKIYLKILSLVSAPDQEKGYKDAYFLAKTRYSATSLASQVSTSESSVTLDKIVGIPTQYYAAKYVQHGLDVTTLGMQVPASLQQFTKLTEMETEQSRTLALDLFKAFVISQLLDQQGLKFTDCYTDYQLTLKSGLSKDTTESIASIQKQVESYFKKIDPKSAVSLFVQGTIIVLQVERMPIPAVTSLYPGGPNAGIYFAGAATLFAPGKKLLQIGGVSYVPGQDEISMMQMYQDTAYAYLSEAQQYLITAQTICAELIATRAKQVKAGKKIDNASFNTQYNDVKQKYIRAQALLMAEGGSAHYYFMQAREAAKAKQVKDAFYNSYKQQIAQFKKLLVGDPTSRAYMSIISDINQAYLSWTSELNPQTDADQIAQNQNAIVDLFQTSAQQCLQYQYVDPMFPKYKQLHYMAAAQNYQSASKQYKGMQEDDKADAMTAKVMQTYFAGCVQNMMLYYSAKNKGVTYTPELIEGQPQQSAKKVTFDQLLDGYQRFQTGGDADSGLIDTYTQVKNLLLDASMLFQMIGNNYEKQAPPVQNSTTGPDGKAKPKASVNSDLLSYLHSQNIINTQFTSIPYGQPGIIKTLFKNGQAVYDHFKDNIAALGNWCNILNMAVAHQYINDFEGGSSVSAGNFQQKFMEFFQAVQKETSSLQNNSSAYIG